MSWKLRRHLIVCTFLGAALLFLAVELYLRFQYGLCSAVLMRADDDYEYIAQPNQKQKRFGNRVLYNSLSMRNEELREGSIRILCLGDSILNGGTLTDQRRLATSILSHELSKEAGKDVQVLNVSAGSWGPDNCMAWLKRHGDFGAIAIVLVVSSHDVHDTMTFVPIVGKSKSFPTRQYSLAIIELLDRYLFPQNKLFNMTKDEADAAFRKEHHIEKTDVSFNPGFQGILDYALERRMPFAIYLHATLYELEKGSYDDDGKAVIDFCQRNSILLFQDLGHGLTQQCIRENDYLHYSDAGQSLMARLLLPFCKDALQQPQR